MPEKAWRYDAGDAGGCDDDSGREGGVMALNLDSPTPPLSAAPLLEAEEPPPPRKLAKEVVGNESATGPELAASVPPKLPGVEVIAGEERRVVGGCRREARRRRMEREAAGRATAYRMVK